MTAFRLARTRTCSRRFSRGAIVLALAHAVGCGGSRSITIVNDVSVSFDAPRDRSPVDPANARLSAAAREVRELLGHPLYIIIDASLAPEYRDGFDSALIHVFEQLATELERAKGKDEATLQLARQKLVRIAVRYAPAASQGELAPRWDASGGIVVTVNAKSSNLIPVGDILWLLRESAEKDQATAFAEREPEAIPPAEHGAYVKWLRGSLDGHTRASDDERKTR